MKTYSTALFVSLLSLFLITCKKNDSSNAPVPDNKIKIEIVSGNNQSDTIGYFLNDTIVLKVTRNNRGLGRMAIICEQADCVFIPQSYLITDSNGLARYTWELNGKTGDQTVRFTVYDTLQIALDSITAHAVGKYYNNA